MKWFQLIDTASTKVTKPFICRYYIYVYENITNSSSTSVTTNTQTMFPCNYKLKVPAIAKAEFSSLSNQKLSK